MADLFDDLFSSYTKGVDRDCMRTTRQLGDQADRLSRLRSENRRLEVRYERLKLVLLAMWTLQKQQHGLTDDDLKAKVRQLDIADGRLDGKADDRERLTQCVNCQRMLLRSAVFCPYCEAENPDFDALSAM